MMTTIRQLVGRLTRWPWMLALGLVAHGILVLVFLGGRLLLCGGLVATFRPEGHPECAFALLSWWSALFYSHTALTVMLAIGLLLRILDRTSAAFCYVASTATMLVTLLLFENALTPLQHPPRWDLTVTTNPSDPR